MKAINNVLPQKGFITYSSVGLRLKDNNIAATVYTSQITIVFFII